jgi:hypothetical protein
MIPKHDNPRKTYTKNISATDLPQEHHLDPPDIPPRKTYARMISANDLPQEDYYDLAIILPRRLKIE